MSIKVASAHGGRTGPVRIAIVDDHELVRLGVAQLITRERGWVVCGEAATAPDGLRMIAQTRPDLALIDLRLSGGDGLELVKQLRTSCPDVLLLVSSMHDEKLYAERCLRAGARGYVSKQESAHTLIAAIHRVLEGQVHLSETMTELVLARTARRGGPVASSPVELLSDRELEVFQMLGRGLSVKAIAAELHLSPNTIEYHRDRIKDKLQLSSSAAVLRHATAWALDHP